MATIKYNNRIGIIRRLDSNEIQIDENDIPLNSFGRNIIDQTTPHVGDEVAFNVHSRNDTLIYLCIVRRSPKSREIQPRANCARRDTSEPDMYGVTYGTEEYDYE